MDNSLAIALIVAGLIALSRLVGFFLQKRLPEARTSERSRDIIGGVVGLLTLLLALVLGLLIGEQRLPKSMQTATPVAWPLVYAVTAWSCLIFFDMGLLARLNPTTFVMLNSGATSVGLAIFLILEPALYRLDPRVAGRPRPRDRAARHPRPRGGRPFAVN